MKEYSIDERLQICSECPIFKPSDCTCNSKLYLNPDTNEVSTHSKPGFIRGCGCYMKQKAKHPSNHCTTGKW